MMPEVNSLEPPWEQSRQHRQSQGGAGDSGRTHLRSQRTQPVHPHGRKWGNALCAAI